MVKRCLQQSTLVLILYILAPPYTSSLSQNTGLTPENFYLEKNT